MSCKYKKIQANRQGFLSGESLPVCEDTESLLSLHVDHGRDRLYICYGLVFLKLFALST